MKPQRHSKDQVLERRQRVAQMYLRGKTLTEISGVVGVTMQQVSKDMMTVRRWWKEAAIKDFDELRAKELAKIDFIETQACAAWERSIGIHEIQSAQKKRFTDKNEGEETVKVIKETLAGDPRFLDVMLSCVTRRCAILGLNAPAKGEIFIRDARYEAYIDPERPSHVLTRLIGPAETVQ